MRAFQNATHRRHWTTRTEDTTVIINAILSGGGCDSKSEEWCRFAKSQIERHVADLTLKVDNFFVLIHT